MPSPRRESSSGPTSASSYVLERKLLRAYDALYQQQFGHIWHAATKQAAQAALLSDLLGPAYAHRWGAKRLTQDMPELILRLTATQQLAVAEVLLCPDADLKQVVVTLAKFERNLNYRDDDPRLSINDDARLKAAGMGKLSKSIYGNLPKLGPPLELTSPPLVLRTKKKAARKPKLVTRRRYPVCEQLCFEFPGGGVTLASL